MTRLFFAAVFLFNQLCFAEGLPKYTEHDHRLATLEVAAQFINSTPNYSELFKTLALTKGLSGEEQTEIENLLRKSSVPTNSALPKVSFAKRVLKIGQFVFEMDSNQQFSYKGISLRKNKTETTDQYISRVAGILQGKKSATSANELLYDLLVAKASAEEEVSMVKEVAKGAAIGLAVTAATLFVVIAAVASSPIMGAVTVASAAVALKGTLATATVAGAAAGGALAAFKANEKRKVACDKNRMVLQTDKFNATYSFGMGSTVTMPGVITSMDGKELKKIEAVDEKQKNELNFLYQEACVRKNAAKVNEILQSTNSGSKQSGDTKSSSTAQ